LPSTNRTRNSIAQTNFTFFIAPRLDYGLTIELVSMASAFHMRHLWKQNRGLVLFVPMTVP
jgi:hypothetical protein